TRTPPTATSSLSLHDALPISGALGVAREDAVHGHRRRRALVVHGRGGEIGARVAPHADRAAAIAAVPPDLVPLLGVREVVADGQDRKSTRLNSSHVKISYAVF